MLRLPHRRRGRRVRARGALLVLLVTVALADSATLAGAAVLHARHLERVSGTNAVTAPSVTSECRTGAFTATIDYASLFSAEGHQVSSEVAWDDDWFFQDPTSYNHELAHACAVLSAVANAESAYYQQGSTSPAYAEHAFAELGFEEVSTTSYRYRSEVVDEVLGLLDGTDVVAYTVATKHVRSSVTGEERLLTVVVVRGSYGSEWLSNAKIEDASDESGSGDHLGFTLAAEEIVADLEARAAETDPGVGRAYLFCGHSRGAAVATLLASYADGAVGPSGARADAIASADSVCAYGLAAPNCTSAADARTARYDNIFNVLNPSDVVTMLPPAAWGYGRYGRDVWLPKTGDDALSDAMRASYEASMGVECPVRAEDCALAEGLVKDVTAAVGGLEELFSPGGLLAFAQACVSADAPQLLASHYPNSYIAWLDAATPEDLAIS